MLEEGEQRLVRPVQVLEHEHACPGRSQALEEAPPGREQLLPLRLRGRLDPHQRPQPLQQPAALRLVGEDSRLQLRRRHLGRVGLEDARLGLDDLPQRPECDPLPVRQAAPLPPACQLRLRLHIGEQLRDQPALAHTRLAHHRHQLHRALLRRPLERPDQQRLLQLAADQRRRVPTSDVGPEASAGRPRPPQRQRLRLPLHHHRSKLLVLEHLARGPVGLLTDRDPAHRRRSLDTGCRVHDITGDQPLPLLGASAERHHRLTGVDPHPHLQVEPGIGLVQLLDRLEDAKGGPDRALGVVLVCDRGSEHGHDRIPDELLHRPPIAFDLGAQANVVRTDARTDVLGICLIGRGGEADQVAEQHRHDLALLLNGAQRLLG